MIFSLLMLSGTANTDNYLAVDNIAAQQKYTRIQRPAVEIVKQLEEQPEKISVELERHGRDIVVHTDDEPLRVQNSADFSKYAQMVPFEYELHRTDEEGAVNVKAQQLTAAQRWRDTEFPAKGDLSNLNSAYEQLDQSALKVAEADATDDDFEEFRTALQATKDELIVAYRDTLDEDIESHRGIIENYQEVERTGKALYGRARDDRYPPEAYQQIYSNSRGALAIMSGTGDFHCSGLLIADEYALTNEHCTQGFFSFRT